MEYNVLVHYQYMPDDGRILEEKILPFESRVSASIVPNLLNPEMTFASGRKICPDVHSENNFYSEKVRVRLKMLQKANSPVFIEGYRHCCERCFDEGRDPHHEYVCADGTAQDFTTQGVNTFAGINLMEKTFGSLEISGLVPPNHQGNEDTKKVARRFDMPYFVVRNSLADYAAKVHSPIKLSLPAWKENGLIILPESRIPEKAPLFYIIYSDIVKEGWEKYRPFFEKSVPLNELKIKNKKPMFADLSEKFLYWGKRRRDSMRR